MGQITLVFVYSQDRVDRVDTGSGQGAIASQAAVPEQGTVPGSGQVPWVDGTHFQVTSDKNIRAPGEGGLREINRYVWSPPS